jgi:hypothetical protein
MHASHAMYYRQKREETSESSFHIHMWMINKLLVQARRNSDKRSLTNYIIASCYQRMLTRLDYRTSESYLKAFTTLTTIDYTEQPHAEQPHTTQHDITRRSEFANDQSFLTNLNRYMPLLDLRSKIPNLALKAKHPDRVDQLYTKETCTEFHLLLCELLERFSDGLKELHNLRGHETDPEEIVEVLNSITLNGSLVRSMIKGGAIKKHLQVIENFLPDMPFGNQTEGDVGDEPEVDDVDDVDELDEVADLDSGEQEALVEAQLLPKWKRCRVWLELLMIHFDSAQILVGFLKRYDPDINLDIKVLTLPLPPSDMLTWRELLKDIGPPLSLDGIMNFLEPDIESESVTDVSNKETQGPTTKTVLRDSSIKSESITGEKGMEGPAAERIRKTKGSTAGDATGKKGKERPAAKAVLQDSEVDSGKMRGPTGEDVLRLVMALSKIPQVTANLKVFADAVDEVCAQLKAVTNCSSPLAAAYTSKIVKRLQSFKDMWIYTSQDDSTGVLAKIAREIRTLRDNGRFHEALRKGSPLDTGTGCKGACHCEAALAAFCCLHPEWGKFVSRLFPCRTQMYLMRFII